MRLWSALNSFSATSNYSRQPASSISRTKDERRRSCRPKKVGSSSSRLPQLQLQLLFKVKTCWTLFTFEVLWNSCNSVIKSFLCPIHPSMRLLIRLHCIHTWPSHVALHCVTCFDRSDYLSPFTSRAVPSRPVQSFTRECHANTTNGLRIDICDRWNMIYYGKCKLQYAACKCI